MKKYPLILSALLLTTNFIASSSEEEQEQAHNTFNATHANKEFLEDPESYKKVGGMCGGYGAVEALDPKAVKMYLAFLTAKVENKVLKEASTSTDAVHRALEEKQEECEELKRQLAELKAASVAQQHRLIIKEQEEEALLLEVNKSTAAAALEAKRVEAFETENTKLKKILADIQAKEQEIQALLRANKDFKKDVEPSQDLSEGKPEEIAASIQHVMQQNEERIRLLQQEKERLEKDRKTSESRVEKLQKAIKANNWYQLLMDDINDRNMSDEDLALKMWSVCTVLGTDLDRLSEGKGQRLIEALLIVTKPYGCPPSDYNPKVHYDFSSCFRTLGNQFVDRNFAWVGGIPIIYDDCTHKGSKFEKNAKSLSVLAKDKFKAEK